MPLFEFDNYSFYKATHNSEQKYRPQFSEMISNKYDYGPFDENITREILKDSFIFFVDHFKQSCAQDKNVRFFQYILSQHEQAIEISIFSDKIGLPNGLTLDYIAKYRRILKMILEQACELNLFTPKEEWKDDLVPLFEHIDDLYYLAEMIFQCVQAIAFQDMIEDAITVFFDKHNLIVFDMKHHYNEILKQIMGNIGSHYHKHVYDEKGLTDLHNAFDNCFGIKNVQIRHLIAAIHEELKDKGGQYTGIRWEDLIQNMVRMFDTNIKDAEVFFKGLTLNKHNKMTLENLVLRPQNINRYLYRPIIIWNIDGNDYALIGENAYTESMLQLITNCISWGKVSEEWKSNINFMKYVHLKENEHDKLLDDALEKNLNAEGILNDRNIKSLRTKNGTISLEKNGVGEVDSIAIVSTRKIIYVIDCKHLQSRFDIVSQKNDYSNFITSYNSQIKRKSDWFTLNKNLLAEHLNIINTRTDIDLSDYSVEGIFVINTPTFYMYNSLYRIYTIDVVVKVLTGELKDKVFQFFYKDEDNIVFQEVSYPYFKKPTYHSLDLFDQTDAED